MEESNIQPVQSPVTVCGDIHGKTKQQDKLISLSHLNILISLFSPFFFSRSIL